MSTMRIGGLASGMDIDSIVEKLMVAERMPMDKLEQQKQIYEWQRDAYRDVNKKMTTLDTYIADNFILKSLNTKTATSSNSDLVSAVATGSASGSLSIEGVSQLAKAARGIGGPINATGSSKVSSLFDDPTKMPKSFTLSAIDSQGKLGEAIPIVIDENTTINDLITKINGSNAGVSALFEKGRLSLTAKNTGQVEGDKPAMKTDGEGEKLFAALELSQLVTESGQNAIFQVNGIATERTTNSFSINGYNINLKSVFNEGAAFAESKKAAEQAVAFAKESLEEKLTELAEGYEGLKLSGNLKADIQAVKDEIAKEAAGPQTALDDASTALTAFTATPEGQIAVDQYSELSKEAIGKLAAATIFSASDWTDYPKIATEDDFNALKKAHDLTVARDAAQEDLTPFQTAKNDLDALVDKYNEANIALVGVTKEIPETTIKTNPVTMTSSTNVDEIMTKVKEFVSTYNGFITDLTAQTKQPKYRDYQPLTELQKKEMEAKDIENWETRAKSGLLRNDSIITSGLSSLRGLVYQTNHAVTNQKYNALYTIGIGTSKDYNSGGTLEIDETKLRRALEEDPDAVVQLLTMSGEKSAMVTKPDGTKEPGDTRGFMRKIRDEMDAIEKKIDERAGRGSMTETQYTLGKYLRNVNQSLDAWKDKLIKIEDRYWKQFGAMESMINKANSQSASLMSQYY